MYRPISAGHTAREAPRRVEQETIDTRLVAIAQEWLEPGRLTYDTALYMTEGIETTARAAGLLAIHPQLQQCKYHYVIGMFISALWNERCPETTIVYPHNTPTVDKIGMRLAQNKILVVAGKIRDFVGCESGGLIIVSGTARDGSGSHPAGAFLSSKKVIFEGRQSSWYLLPEIQNYYPELKRYTDNILSVARNDPLMIEDAFGNAQEITKKLNELIWR